MIYSCIDIGSDTIKIVVGRINDDKLDILGATNTRSVGIKKGLIVDAELAMKSIMLAQEEMEKQIGFKIDKAIINVPFYDVSVGVYNGMCYPEGEITGDDVITCFKSCVSTIDIDLEVVSVFPIYFLIDDEKKTLNPKGETGNKLECRMLISTVPKQVVYPYLEVLEKCNIEVIDLSFGIINDFYNVRGQEELKNSCGAVVDIGKDKTEIAIFNKGLMIKGDTLQIGSKLIDHDISYIYHLDNTTARYLKENFAYVSSQYADSERIVEYETSDGEKIKISELEISQIVEARLEEILKNVKKSLNNLTNREISYIIVAGGISNAPGFDYLVSNILGDMAYAVNLNTIGVRNNIYTSCVGMIKYYYDKLLIRGINYTMYEKMEDALVNKKSLLHEKIIDDMKKYLEDN